MKNILITVFALLATCSAANSLNLIPAPAFVEETEGYTLLSPGFGIVLSGDISDEMKNEATAFTGSHHLQPAISATGIMQISTNEAIAPEGYTIDCNSNGISIEASDANGLFHAFQTLAQLEQNDTVPAVKIQDAPRFPYRGFMLDVSRHFFDVVQIKRMIDLMAAYKMNCFHWHLTDDQGWRFPVPEYPELTTTGATNRNILLTDFEKQTKRNAGADTVYGPFAYTEDEIRDVVAYAKKRHIDVLPEIDMPGHMVAAIHAYPSFSTDPDSKLVPDSIDPTADVDNRNPYAHFTHNIWNCGGVAYDVLDISNPAVMEFLEKVIDQLANLFPYEYIHIGGDECPTMAWSLHDGCTQLKDSLGLDNFRALQSWFNTRIAAYAKQKHNKKIYGWNELISEKDADLDAVKSIEPRIMCWMDIDKSVPLASSLGLPWIYTPINKGYYINRSYKGYDTFGAGRDGSLEQTYTELPPEYPGCIGVQGTFWTEQVSRNADLEYLALPRLLAIAEHGWSMLPSKDYNDFIRRVTPHILKLKAAGYNPAMHQVDALRQ